MTLYFPDRKWRPLEMSIFAADGLDVPASLSEDRCRSFLPRMEINPEWQRKHDEGELASGLSGMFGMLDIIWPDEKPTPEEARFILALRDRGSMRWLAEQLVGDDNQIHGMHLIEAAEMAISEDPSK